MFFDDYSAELKQAMDKISREEIEKLYSFINEAREKGKHVFLGEWRERSSGVPLGV